MHINEVILYTGSVARTKLFYTKTLELPVISETTDAIAFQIGETLLTFKAATEQKPYYHIAFNITNNKFSDSFEWINNKLDILIGENGLPIFTYPEWNAESFYFFDNNGTVLEFIARFDLPYHSAAPFSLSDIRGVSEVGIVCNDITATAAQLHARYDVPYFAKSKPTPHFTAMGDDNGLFIIVSPGHKWVPTNKLAQVFPLVVMANGQTIEIQ